jgi:molybdopterin synthase sulfur carrier subunit
MSNAPITVTVKLFAAYQEAYGRSEISLHLPSDSPVKIVLEKVIREHPSLEQWRETTRFGINLNFASPDTLLQEGDEVVLIPPVSGGSIDL